MDWAVGNVREFKRMVTLPDIMAYLFLVSKDRPLKAVHMHPSVPLDKVVHELAEDYGFQNAEQGLKSIRWLRFIGSGTWVQRNVRTDDFCMKAHQCLDGACSKIHYVSLDHFCEEFQTVGKCRLRGTCKFYHISWAREFDVIFRAFILASDELERDFLLPTINFRHFCPVYRKHVIEDRDDWSRSANVTKRFITNYGELGGLRFRVVAREVAMAENNDSDARLSPPGKHQVIQLLQDPAKVIYCRSFHDRGVCKIRPAFFCPFPHVTKALMHDRHEFCGPNPILESSEIRGPGLIFKSSAEVAEVRDEHRTFTALFSASLFVKGSIERDLSMLSPIPFDMNEMMLASCMRHETGTVLQEIEEEGCMFIRTRSLFPRAQLVVPEAVRDLFKGSPYFQRIYVIYLAFKDKGIFCVDYNVPGVSVCAHGRVQCMIDQTWEASMGLKRDMDELCEHITQNESFIFGNRELMVQYDEEDGTIKINDLNPLTSDEDIKNWWTAVVDKSPASITQPLKLRGLEVHWKIQLKQTPASFDDTFKIDVFLMPVDWQRLQVCNAGGDVFCVTFWGRAVPVSPLQEPPLQHRRAAQGRRHVEFMEGIVFKSEHDDLPESRMRMDLNHRPPVSSTIAPGKSFGGQGKKSWDRKKGEEKHRAYGKGAHGHTRRDEEMDLDSGGLKRVMDEGNDGTVKITNGEASDWGQNDEWSSDAGSWAEVPVHSATQEEPTQDGGNDEDHGDARSETESDCEFTILPLDEEKTG